MLLFLNSYFDLEKLAYTPPHVPARVTGSKISFSMSYDCTVPEWDKVHQPDIAVHQLSMCTGLRWT